MNGKLVIPTPVPKKGKLASNGSSNAIHYYSNKDDDDDKDKIVLGSTTDTTSLSTSSTATSVNMYSFPTVQQLASASESDLRALGKHTPFLLLLLLLLLLFLLLIFSFSSTFLSNQIQTVLHDSVLHLRFSPISRNLLSYIQFNTAGMGYRASFLIESAKHVLSMHEDPTQWFQKLRLLSTMKDGVDSIIKGTDGIDEISGNVADLSATADNMVGHMHDTFGHNRLHVQAQLQQMKGVGRKVADCVALFSLDQTGCIPVDTHVWRIANRDYPAEYHALRTCPVKTDKTATATVTATASAAVTATEIKEEDEKKYVQNSTAFAISTASEMFPVGQTENVNMNATGAGLSSPNHSIPLSITPAVYEAVGTAFRMRFGSYAGWAQIVLFTAELPEFRKKHPVEMQEEMKAFREEQKA